MPITVESKLHDQEIFIAPFFILFTFGEGEKDAVRVLFVMGEDFSDQALKREKSVQSFFEICVIKRAWSGSRESSKNFP